MSVKALIIAGLLPMFVLQAQSNETRSTTIDIPVDRVVALVGRTPILWSELQEQVNIRRAQGLTLPDDPAEQLKVARQVLDDMIDVEVMVQRALTDTSIVVTDIDVQASVDERMTQIRQRFNNNDQELAQALRQDGFGSVEEYRRWMTEQARRATLQQQLVQKLRQEGKVITVAVSEAEISEAFEKERARLPKRPATVTFRQIVIATAASEEAKKKAYARAESLWVELRDGGDFENIARRESQDSTSAAQGGDLGWTRRERMVPAFDNMLFALPVGQISPIVETQYGFHIIRVDRAQPAERKARHILIKPEYDSADVARAKQTADSALALWRAGTPFDTLVARYHDLASDEVRGVLEPFERAKLPEAYQKAFDGKDDDDFVEPFELEDRSRGVPKFVVAQLIDVASEGDYTIQDLRNQIRDQLSEEKSMRRMLDGLRRETFVRIMLEEPRKVASP
ncbi:MAG: foldase protein PrsA [Gemmatimonadota bacterium]